MPEDRHRRVTLRRRGIIIVLLEKQYRYKKLICFRTHSFVALYIFHKRGVALYPGNKPLTRRSRAKGTSFSVTEIRRRSIILDEFAYYPLLSIYFSCHSYTQEEIHWWHCGGVGCELRRWSLHRCWGRFRPKGRWRWWRRRRWRRWWWWWWWIFDSLSIKGGIFSSLKISWE